MVSGRLTVHWKDRGGNRMLSSSYFLSLVYQHCQHCQPGNCAKKPNANFGLFWQGRNTKGSKRTIQRELVISSVIAGSPQEHNANQWWTMMMHHWWCNSILCTVASEGGLFHDCWVRKKGKREKVFATFIVGPDEDEDHWIRIVSRIRINEQCHQSAVLLDFFNCGHIFFAAMYKKNFLIQMKFATMGKNGQI